MMQNRDPRQMDDEALDLAQQGANFLRTSPLFGSDPTIRDVIEGIDRETSRRAEIRLNRMEIGESHDASWYESRQTEAQWLQEIGDDGEEVVPFWSEEADFAALQRIESYPCDH